RWLSSRYVPRLLSLSAPLVPPLRPLARSPLRPLPTTTDTTPTPSSTRPVVKRRCSSLVSPEMTVTSPRFTTERRLRPRRIPILSPLTSLTESSVACASLILATSTSWPSARESPRDANAVTGSAPSTPTPSPSKPQTLVIQPILSVVDCR
ncbi:hypothetical protein PMAYCL1PPCAC_23107, partial [Pristionchus mayeri]